MGSDMPPQPAPSSSAASIHEMPPSKEAYVASVKSYVCGLLNRLDAPTMFNELLGLTATADSLRA